MDWFIDKATNAPYRLNLKANKPVTISEIMLPDIFATTSFVISFLPFKTAKNKALKLNSTKNTANHTNID